jgi:hypothetical protein
LFGIVQERRYDGRACAVGLSTHPRKNGDTTTKHVGGVITPSCCCSASGEYIRRIGPTGEANGT